MRLLPLPSLACAASLALAACSASGQLGVTTLPAASPAATAGPAAGAGGTASVGAVITGNVLAPTGLIAVGGGNLIAAGGGNLIAAGAGNLIAAGAGNLTSRALLADGLDQKPLVNAEVFLADGAGNPIPKLAHAMTDAKGQYSLPNVPPGFSFVVAAKVKTKDGKDALIRTLAKSTALGTTANLDAGTSLVTASVVAGGKGDIGDFNPITLKAAAEKVNANLTDATLPDFSDNAKLAAKMDELAQSVVELKGALAELKKDLSDIKATLGDLKATIEAQAQVKATTQPLPEATEAPAATPAPTKKPEETPQPNPNQPTATPTVPPKQEPTASPKQEATPTPAPTESPKQEPTPTPTPKQETTSSKTLSGVLVANPDARGVVVTAGMHLHLRNYALTPYGTYDADIKLDANGAWTGTVRFDASATNNQIVVEVLKDGGTEGIGNINISAAGVVTYDRLYSGQYPSYLIRLN